MAAHRSCADLETQTAARSRFPADFFATHLTPRNSLRILWDMPRISTSKRHVSTTIKLGRDQLDRLRQIEAETGLKRSIFIDRLLDVAAQRIDDLVRPAPREKTA